MNRNNYLKYLNRFDTLMGRLNYPNISRELSRAVKNGMAIEEIAFYHSIPIGELENELELLATLQELTIAIQKESQ